MADQFYVARTNLLIPNPGQVPSALRLEPGDIFSLDGSEGLHVDRLLRGGAIVPYEGPPIMDDGEQQEPPAPKKKERQRLPRVIRE